MNFIYPQSLPDEKELLLNEVSGAAGGTKPIVLPLDNSSVIVLWEDSRNAQKLYQNTIYAQRVHYPDVISRNVALTALNGFAVNPDAVLLSDKNNFVLSWQEYTPDLKYTTLLFRDIDTTCSSFQKIYFISDDSLRYPVRPRIDILASERVVIWGQSAEKLLVMLRIFDRYNQPISDTIRLNGAASLNALLPAVAVASNSNIRSVWIDKGDLKRSIVMQRLFPNGKRDGQYSQLSNFTEDLQITSPEIISLPDSKSVTIWADARGGKWNVYAQLIDEDGFRLFDNIVVSTTLTPSILPDVAVAVNSKGLILIAWETRRGDYFTLAGQWMKSDGSFVGQNFYLLKDGNYDSRKPSARCEANDAFVSWLDNRFTDTPTRFDVFVKKIHEPQQTSINTDLNFPVRFILEQNYPNPFSERTNIRVHSSRRGEFTVSSFTIEKFIFKVYDVFGREVLDLSKQIVNSPSADQLTIDNYQLPAPGVYFYRLSNGYEVLTRTMIYME